MCVLLTLLYYATGFYCSWIKIKFLSSFLNNWGVIFYPVYGLCLLNVSVYLEFIKHVNFFKFLSLKCLIFQSFNENVANHQAVYKNLTVNNWLEVYVYVIATRY